ncbi:MAG: leucyl/phenylalanyl-tRNA--protein transferase [Phycisphaeraceae bacterium]|nr:leucyl/phenylalanyl-tRNA--protein transferase [Phycisphaeraceae bacterium]MCW5764192.1 leucyl/phenylalanyl-tRNA--protein transferase [Phycisphaeraceae bacterium]
MTSPPDQAPSTHFDPTIVRAILAAYAQGLFPMADPDSGEIHWFDPPVRGIIPLDDFRISRSLAQRVRSRRFAITADTAFDAVIEACSRPRAGPGGETWIDHRIRNAYSMLHRAGHAHSVEAWLTTEQGPILVGGLYGVALGGLFAGESMFSRPDLGGTDASKVCLVHLVAHLRRRGYTLLDTQFTNPHLVQFGCTQITRRAYMVRLRESVNLQCEWQPFV